MTGLAGVALVVWHKIDVNEVMRRGRAAKVASLIYLTPIIPILLELVMFDIVPTGISMIGVAVTLSSVALVSWRHPDA